MADHFIYYVESVKLTDQNQTICAHVPSNVTPEKLGEPINGLSHGYAIYILTPKSTYAEGTMD
jgi:hypothetical protein